MTENYNYNLYDYQDLVNEEFISGSTGCKSNVETENTDSISFTGDGSVCSPLKATGKLSEVSGNIISILPDGFYASGDTGGADLHQNYIGVGDADNKLTGSSKLSFDGTTFNLNGQVFAQDIATGFDFGGSVNTHTFRTTPYTIEFESKQKDGSDVQTFYSDFVISPGSMTLQNNDYQSNTASNFVFAPSQIEMYPSRSNSDGNPYFYNQGLINLTPEEATFRVFHQTDTDNKQSQIYMNADPNFNTPGIVVSTTDSINLTSTSGVTLTAGGNVANFNPDSIIFNQPLTATSINTNSIFFPDNSGDYGGNNSSKIYSIGQQIFMKTGDGSTGALLNALHIQSDNGAGYIGWYGRAYFNAPVAGSIQASDWVTGEPTNFIAGTIRSNSDGNIVARQITNGVLSGFSIEAPDAFGNVEAAVFKLNFQSGEIRIGAVASGGYYPTFYSNGTEAMRLSPNGNLLLGTTIDDGVSRFHILSNVNSASSMVFENVSNGTSAYAGMQLKNDNGSSAYIYKTSTTYSAATANSLYIQETSGDIVFYTHTESMRITHNGAINISNVLEFSDNAAALSGGLVAGDIYRTGEVLKIVF